MPWVGFCYCSGPSRIGLRLRTEVRMSSVSSKINVSWVGRVLLFVLGLV